MNEKLNKQEKETNKLRVVSAADIEANLVYKDDLWFILVREKLVGPFHKNDLKEFLNNNPHFPLNTKISNYNTPENLVPIFSLVQFQRRKPQLVPAPMDAKENEIFLLSQGLKNGPYTYKEVAELIDQKKILYNDLISVDEGITWIKVYEYPSFNRRGTGAKTLPIEPSIEVFYQSDKEIALELTKKKGVDDDNEGLVGLAYIGIKNSKAAKAAKAADHSREEKEVPATTTVVSSPSSSGLANNVQQSDKQSELISLGINRIIDEDKERKKKIYITLAITISLFVGCVVIFLLLPSSHQNTLIDESLENSLDSSFDTDAIEGTSIAPAPGIKKKKRSELSERTSVIKKARTTKKKKYDRAHKPSAPSNEKENISSSDRIDPRDTEIPTPPPEVTNAETMLEKSFSAAAGAATVTAVAPPPILPEEPMLPPSSPPPAASGMALVSSPSSGDEFLDDQNTVPASGGPTPKGSGDAQGSETEVPSGSTNTPPMATESGTAVNSAVIGE
ncbi:MAG: hypothetical protein HQK53_13120 [Oligoflexia bacterium]|nr:hypothetical protein [Oligoflexia bacterium]